MARRAVRLLLAVVLAAVLFHPDAAEEGKEAPARPEGVVPYHRCGACEVDVTKALSPVNKVPAIGEITGIAENVCKQVVADDVLLVFQDEERRCIAECRTSIERAWLEVMKHDNDIVWFIYKEKPSIQQLMKFLCKESPRSAEGEDDDNESKLETMIKKFGRNVKEVPLWFGKLWQKEKSTNRAKACKNLNTSLE